MGQPSPLLRMKMGSRSPWLRLLILLSLLGNTYSHFAMEDQEIFLGGIWKRSAWQANEKEQESDGADEKMADIVEFLVKTIQTNPWVFVSAFTLTVIGFLDVDAESLVKNEKDMDINVCVPIQVTLATPVYLWNWMKYIDGGRLVSEFTIPGTHDSGTYNVYQSTGVGYVKTQALSFTEQLNIGCRFFDIRLKTFDQKHLLLYHGPFPLHLDFHDVLNECKLFLRNNPSETILMSINAESGSDIADTFMNYYHEDSAIWYTKHTIPKLNDVRRKIVLMCRFYLPIGMRLPVGYNCRSCRRLCTDPDEYLLCEDRFNPNSIDEKWQNIFENVKQAENNRSANNLFLTFTSGYIVLAYIPKTMAYYINNWIMAFFQINGKNKGIFGIDFIDTKMALFLVRNNFHGKNTYYVKDHVYAFSRDRMIEEE